MQSLQEIHSFLTNLLVVALSEDIGCIDNASVPVEICLISINNCIKGVNIDQYNTEDDIPSKDFNLEDIPKSWRE